MNRRMTVLFIVIFANFIASMTVQPILPLYAMRRFDASPQMIALLLASYFVALFIASPIIGQLADRFGRVPILLASQVGTLLSFVILLTSDSLLLAFIARILDGITGGNVILAQAYITDITPKQTRTRSLGMVWMAFGLGYVVGPALGGLSSAFIDDHAPFLLASGFALLTILLTAFALPESLTADRRATLRAGDRKGLRLADIRANRGLRLILVIAFGTQTCLALMLSTLTLYSEGVLFAGQSKQNVDLGVGLLSASIGMAQFLTQLVLIKSMIAHWGEQRLIIGGLFFRGVGLLILITAVSPWIVGAAALPIFAAASGVMMPSLQSLATMTTTEDRSGSVLGIYNSVISLGIIMGNALGGVLFAQMAQLPFIVGVVIVWAMLPAALRLYRQQPGMVQATTGD